MKKTSYQTDLDFRTVEELLWRVQLTDRLEDLCDLTDAAVNFLESLIDDPTGTGFPFLIKHDHFRDFYAQFTLLGQHDGQVWGRVDSSAPVAISVQKRYQNARVIEDEGVLSMISPDFNNLACLRLLPDGSVRLTIGYSRNELEPELETLNLLTSSNK